MARLLPLLALGLSLATAGSGLADTAPTVDNGYLKLGFDRLSGFKFVAPNYDPITDANKPPPTGEDQIPARVKEYSGKRAVITGFMLPTKLDNGKATEFLIMANQMACCFGTVPNMNDWVVVHMPQGVPGCLTIQICGFFRNIGHGAKAG